MQSTVRVGFEWKTKTKLFGLPLLHIALGRDATTGTLLVAKGIIAIGQFAIGVISIAQCGVGIITVAQCAVGVYLGIGQLAAGMIAIAQCGFGKYVLAQIGYGSYAWTMIEKNSTALSYFKHLF